MPKTKFTQLTVDRLSAPAEGRVDWFDNQLGGFGIRLSNAGGRVYFLLTRLKTGKQVRIKIGSAAMFPNVGDARDRAIELLREIERGVDPTVKPEPPRAPDTVKMVCDDFITRYAMVHNKAWKGTEAMLKNHVLPEWGDRDVKTITRADVRKLLANLKDAKDQPMKGIGVNRVLANLRKLFNWAAGEDLIEKTPVDGVKAPAKEIERDRALSDAELRLVWNAAESIGGVAGGFVRMLVLTAQRRSEVATMRWADIDMKEKVWHLPRESTKADRSHDVPLSPQAMAVLEKLPKIGKSPFVFPGRRAFNKGVAVEVPICGFSKIKIALDAKIAEAVAKAAADRGDDPVPVAPWRLHDLRRTAGTGMAGLHVPTGTISKVLNHAEGGVTRIYVRHGFLDEKRAALDTWGKFVEALVDPKPADNVVQLRA